MTRLKWFGYVKRIKMDRILKKVEELDIKGKSVEAEIGWVG